MLSDEFEKQIFALIFVSFDKLVYSIRHIQTQLQLFHTSCF